MERDAGIRDIKRAFYKLAKQYHPDVSPNGTEFIKILNAYKTLIDDKRRKQYEGAQSGKKRIVLPGERIFYAVSLKDIAHRTPYPSKRRTRQSGSYNRKGYHMCVNLTGSELTSGADVSIDVPAHVICPLCHGHHTTCSFCSDRGYILKAVPVVVAIPNDIGDGDIFQVSLRNVKRERYAFFVVKNLLIKIRVFQDNM